MKSGEQDPKKSREEKPAKPADKNPANRELDESELEEVAGGQEQKNKLGNQEQDGKTVS